MSRDLILAKIRAALGHRETAGGARRRGVERRLAAPVRFVVPSRTTTPGRDRVDAFKGRLAAQAVVVEEVGGAEAIPGAVARLLAAARMPPSIRLGADPFLASLRWEKEAAGLRREFGAAAADDPAALSHALAGIAETGTLVLASGADNPVTLSFLPDLHIVTVDEATIVDGLEDAFGAARARFGNGLMPRTLNLVSGASRTGDIGSRLVMGAHGPRQLAVLVFRRR